MSSGDYYLSIGHEKSELSSLFLILILAPVMVGKWDHTLWRHAGAKGCGPWGLKPQPISWPTGWVFWVYSIKQAHHNVHIFIMCTLHAFHNVHTSGLSSCVLKGMASTSVTLFLQPSPTRTLPSAVSNLVCNLVNSTLLSASSG